MKIASTDAPQLRHIVDVDGLLIGIEPATVSTTMLQALAGVGGDLFQLFGEREVALGRCQAIPLREDEILYFRSRKVTVTSKAGWHHRLAA